MINLKPTCDTVLADDSPTDLALLARALHDMTNFHIMHMAHGGQEVIDYLAGNEPFTDRKHYPLPHLLILDLKMPRVDGFDVLRWIRAHGLRLVTVLLTGSMHRPDLELAGELGADAVFVKPLTLTHLREMATRVEQFCKPPPKASVAATDVLPHGHIIPNTVSSVCSC